MAWPNVPCPLAGGPTANDHLDYIKGKANTELAPGPLLNKINNAVAKCRGNTCLPNGAPPPDACEHRERLRCRQLVISHITDSVAAELAAAPVPGTRSVEDGDVIETP